MTGVATAIITTGVVGAYMQGQAAKGAAQTQADASNRATDVQQGMFNTQVANEKPYLDAGTKALDQIQSNMPSYNQPFTMGMFHEDPGYQFDLQQGEQAIENSSAASGHMISSQQLGNASNYAQSMASNEFGNAFSRYQTQQSNSYNRLASLAQLGQTGASNVNSAAQNAGNNISGNIIGAGNASAAAQVGTANAITGGIGAATNGLMNYNLMNNLMPKPTTTPMPGAAGQASLPSYGNYDPSGSGNMGVGQFSGGSTVNSLY